MASSQHLLDSLQRVGLTANEAEIYTALIDLSPTFVAPLVKATAKHRQMVYNALDTLLARNLITRSVKNGKFFYELGDPDRLVQIIKEQAVVAQELAGSISSQISRPDEQVEILRGAQSIQQANYGMTAIAHQTREYIIMHTIPEEYLSFTSGNISRQLKGLRDLKKDGVPLYLLAFSSKESQLHNPGFWPSIDDPYEARVTDSTPEPPQTIWITGDHVYLRNHLADPILIHIVSSDLAARYREYFYGYWHQARPVHRV